MPDVRHDRVVSQMWKHDRTQAAIRLDGVPDTEEVDRTLALSLGRAELLGLAFERMHAIEEIPRTLEPSREVGVTPLGEAASVDESRERANRERPAAEAEEEDSIVLFIELRELKIHLTDVVFEPVPKCESQHKGDPFSRFERRLVRAREHMKRVGIGDLFPEL